MLNAVRGTLVSEYFAEHLLAERFAGRLGEGQRERARHALARMVRSCRALGPASGIRALFDVGASALAQILGFRVVHLRPLSHPSLPAASRARVSFDAEPALAALIEHEQTRVA